MHLMKHQSFIVGILLTQAALPQVAAKPLTLYRVDGNKVANKATNTNARINSNNLPEATLSASEVTVEDFSDEFYNDANVPEHRALYQSEEDKLIKERRDLFTRNLLSMSISLSFNVIIAPPPFTETGGEDQTSYDILRDKLLGSGASDEDDQASIDKANELASNGEVTAFAGTEVETVLDIAPTDAGYVSVREKLLGKGDDVEFEATIEEDIDKANSLAAHKSPVTGKENRNLRRR